VFCNKNSCSSLENNVTINTIEKPVLFVENSSLCNSPNSTVVLKARNLIANAQIQWYKNDTLLLGATDTILEVSSKGQYYFITTTQESFPAWVSVGSNINSDLKDVTFINEKNGWAIGVNNLINTRNGGTTWNTQLIGDNWTKIQMIDDSTGYVISTTGKIHKTSNGGLSWSVLVTNTNAKLKTFHFLNIDYGWAVGDSGTVVKTLNGGQTWFVVNPPLSNSSAVCFGVYFQTLDKGFIGTYDHILKTTDGGQTWVQDFGTTYYSKDFNFTSTSTGYVLGNELIKTTNGGSNWSSLNVWDLDYQFLNDTLGSNFLSFSKALIY
jgi:photosystem II stability/assembly factor-like uncharacterized protein